MAAEQGLAVEPELICAGGASLRRHWNGGQATATIESGAFTHVVLQEQSTLPVKNASRMAENFRLFDDVIKGAGSKTVLYMTWARQHSPEQQSLIADAYESIGNEMDATVIPVGLVWQAFIPEHPSPNLYASDQSHPSLAGSYLAACVFLSVLFAINPVASEAVPAGIDPADAAAIQRFVWKRTASS
jgi:hypothetical protein